MIIRLLCSGKYYRMGGLSFFEDLGLLPFALWNSDQGRWKFEIPVQYMSSFEAWAGQWHRRSSFRLQFYGKVSQGSFLAWLKNWRLKKQPLMEESQSIGVSTIIFTNFPRKPFWWSSLIASFHPCIPFLIL